MAMSEWINYLVPFPLVNVEYKIQSTYAPDVIVEKLRFYTRYDSEKEKKKQPKVRPMFVGFFNENNFEIELVKGKNRFLDRDYLVRPIIKGEIIKSKEFTVIICKVQYSFLKKFFPIYACFFVLCIIFLHFFSALNPKILDPFQLTQNIFAKLSIQISFGTSVAFTSITYLIWAVLVIGTPQYLSKESVRDGKRLIQSILSK